MKKNNTEHLPDEEVKEKISEEVPDVSEEEKEAAMEVSVEETLKSDLEEMENKYLRAQAEIVNMRNRHNKEREDAAKYRAQELAKSLLTSLDNLDRALGIETTDSQGESLKKGIEMVREGMIHALKDAGVEEIPALNEAFDPNKHQAVQTVPLSDGQEADQIVEVLQKGYSLRDRVLRPAMVIVTQ